MSYDADKHEDLKIDLPPTHQETSMTPTLGSAQDPDVVTKIGWRTWLALASAAIALFQQIYTVIATAVSVRAAAAVLGDSEISIWNNQVYTIMIGCVGPPVALGSDYIGRRNVMLISYVIVLAGCLISSESTSMGMLIAGRTLTALSAAVQGLTTAIPSEVLPHAQRALAQAGPLIGGAGGGVSAALLSGYLAGSGPNDWRWVFRLEALLSAIVFVFIAVCYHPPPRPVDPTLSFRAKLAKIDVLSSFLLACFFVPFIAALTQGGNTQPWSSAPVLAPLVVSMAFLVLLIVYSVVRKDGLIHHDLFNRSRNYSVALVCVGFEGAVYLAFLSFYPPLVGLSFGDSGVSAGARTAMLSIGGTISALFVGWISTKTKNLRLPVIIGFLLYAVGMIGLACLPFASHSGVAWFWALLIGFGIGPLLVNLVVLAQLATPGHIIGLSTSLLFSFRAVVGGVFIAICTAVVNAKLPVELANAIVPAVTDLGVSPTSTAFGQNIGAVIAAGANFDATGLGQALVAIGVSPQTLPQAIPAVFGAVAYGFGASYRWAFVILAPLAVVAAFVSLAFADARGEMNQILDAPAELVHHEKHGGI